MSQSEKPEVPKIVYDEVEESPRENKYQLEVVIERLSQRTKNWQKNNRKGPQPSVLFVKERHYFIESESMRCHIYRWNRERQNPITIRKNDDEIRIYWVD